jgi:hypothetical protein
MTGPLGQAAGAPGQREDVTGSQEVGGCGVGVRQADRCLLVGEELQSVLAQHRVKPSSGVSISDAGQARNSIRAAPADAGRAAASASIGSLISLATTRPPGPTAAAASRATGPGPLATSSTDQPGRRSARLSSSAAHGSKSWRSMNRS